MAQEIGEITLNSKRYRIDINSWREKDMSDFAPRATTPGGSLVMSELLLYQKQWQTDWRHGFGWMWYEDASGYMRSEGNIDTRNADIAMLMTKSTLSDEHNAYKSGIVNFNGSLYSYGEGGLRKFAKVARLTAPPKLTVSNPTESYTIQADESSGKDTYINSGATTTNYDAQSTLWIGNADSKNYRTLLDWNFDNVATYLPRGATIDTVKLTLVIKADHATNAPTIQVYRLKKAWDETKATHVKATDTVNWSTAGCADTTNDYDGANLVGSVTLLATEAVGKVVEITLDKTLFQEYLANPTTYFGLVLKTSAESSDAYEFYASRDATATNRPKLTITTIITGNVDIGQHTYKVTLYDNGGETDGGVVSSTVTIGTSAKKVNLSNIPVGGTGTVGRRIYRTKSTANDRWYLLVELADNTTTTYQDDTADASLSATEIPTVNGTLSTYEQWSSEYSTNAVHYALATKDYLFYCPNGARLRKLDTSGVHTEAGVNSSAADFKQLVIFEGYVFGFQEGTNQVHYAANIDLSDMEGVTTDPGISYCGPGANAIVELFTYAGKLYASKFDGIWSLSDDKKVWRKMLNYSSEPSSTNFRGLVEYNGAVMYSMRNKVYSWNGARYNNVSPRKLTDTFPYVTYGMFRNFVETDGYMYCTARTNEVTYTEVLLCYDGAGWHKLLDLITDGIGSCTMLGFDVVNSYLWVHIDKGDAGNQTSYIPMQPLSEYPYADFPTTGTHCLITARYDMGFRDVIKSTPTLEVQASNVSLTRYLAIDYSLDGGSWVFWGNITSNGTTTLSTPGSLRTVEYNWIQFRIRFVTDSATQSPILEGLLLRMLMRPDEFYGWNFDVLVATELTSMESWDSRTSYEIATSLKAARASKAPIELKDVFGISRWGYLSSLTFMGLEYFPDEVGGVPNVELIGRCSFVEVK